MFLKPTPQAENLMGQISILLKERRNKPQNTPIRYTLIIWVIKVPTENDMVYITMILVASYL